MADQQNQKRPRIVIVGAGFGGVKLAKLFAKEDVDVMLVDHHNFQLFQPLLYQVSTAVLSTDEIAYPVRTFFRKCKNVEFFMAKAEGVDQARKVLLTNHGELAYDYLILAAGATTNYFGMKEVEAIIARVRRDLGLGDYAQEVLFSRTRFKQTGARYA